MTHFHLNCLVGCCSSSMMWMCCTRTTGLLLLVVFLCCLHTVSSYECGSPVGDYAKFIVGGTNTEHGEWPWQVLVRTRTNAGTISSCGGSLIANNWVMTAAHCVYARPPEAVRVTLGEYDLNQNDGTEVVRSVKGVSVHPYYSSSTLNNDIALLELLEPVEYNDKIIPVCLPTQHAPLPPDQSICFMTGWGQSTVPGSLHPLLQEGRLQIRTNAECREQNGGPQVTDKMLCAGDGVRVSACYGDSGGPLVCETQGRWFVHGVTSWGSEDCRADVFYSVFSRVRSNVDWIKQVSGVTPPDVPTEAPFTGTTPEPPTTVTTPDPCAGIVCDTAVRYVCGNNGVTYPNECALKLASCRCPRIKYRHNGKCRWWRIPRMCRSWMRCRNNYSPVCGVNGQTYDNVCKMQKAFCKGDCVTMKPKHIGPCQDPSHECHEECSTERNMVCGSNDHTYHNDCHLKYASCKCQLVSKAYDGPCRSWKGRQCPRYCSPRDIRPVCGTDGETYRSPCTLKQQFCKGTCVSQASEGHCPAHAECPKFCARFSAPLCGSDGKTYDNECEFKKYRCASQKEDLEIKSQGRCPLVCPEPCGRARWSERVCGTDGRTYPSKCQLEQYQCRGRNVQVKHKGSCSWWWHHIVVRTPTHGSFWRFR